MEVLTSGQRVSKGIGGLLLGLILVILYAPILIMFVLSFQERTTAVFPPSQFSAISYEKLAEPSNFALFKIPGEPLANYGPPLELSLMLSLVVAVTATTLALMAALAFRERFRGRGTLFYALLLGMLTPGVILGLGMRLFADKVGLQAGAWTTGLLVEVAWTMPFGFIIFIIFLNRYDRSVEEAAAVLGASPWRVFRTVTLPLLRPGVMASLLFAFTLSFDEVQRSSLVLGRDQTLPQALLAATQVRITPVVYALGSLIALTSLAVLAVYILGFERARRRVYEEEGEPVSEPNPTPKVVSA